MKVSVAIVGGGIAGLAAAGWLQADHGIQDLVVLEAAGEPGGKVGTRWEDGCCLEEGPQGFLDSAPDTLELATAFGLEDEAVRTPDPAAARFIVRGGRPRLVPSSPPAFFLSDVLPPLARLRVALEPLAQRHPGGDETVREFAARRIGPVAADVLVDAMVTGVFAGDPARLSLAATFPKMAAMEARYGSLTRALLARRKEGGGPSGPAGVLATFRRGMAALPRAIAASLGDRLHTATPVEAIGRAPDGGFRLLLPGGELDAERLLLATPAAATARLLEALAPAAVPALEAMETAPVAVVMTAYRNPLAFGRPVTGFGVLVPGREPLGILGTLFCHSIFPSQAPDSWLLLRTMLGGARDPEAVTLDDATLLAHTRAALASILGADPEPDRTWIVRHREAIAQYTTGHLHRVERAESAARAAGIELTGSAYRGVSVNDCIRQARESARRLVEQPPSADH